MRAATYSKILLAPLVIVCAGASVAGEAQERGVLVNGGSFLMGTPESGIGDLRARYDVSFRGSFENESHAHDVTLSSFRIDRHEVTNARFAAFVTVRPEWGPGRIAADLHNGKYLEHWASGSYPEGKGEHPVAFVTWHAAQAFCRWDGGRLPTEAEWEFAARGGDEREFPWGNELPSPDRANYGASGLRATTPVGSYAATAAGLHDMAGNVWEWVLDAWEPAYAPASRTDPIAGGPVRDDAIREVGGRRVIRGGSYGGAVVNLRTRWRDSHEVTNATDFVGFRCARPVDARSSGR